MTDAEKHPAEGLPFDNIEMLSQPLLTEEGFINEACMNEMAAAIAAIPPAYERLAGDTEWSKPWPTTMCEILGGLANYAVQQSGGYPPGLDRVLGYLRQVLITSAFATENLPIPDEKVRVTYLSLLEINKLLHDILEELEDVKRWNEADEMLPLDWIDLDALFRNVCLDIKKERRHSLAFNREFEAEHGEGLT